jgi:hypothetical protein
VRHSFLEFSVFFTILHDGQSFLYFLLLVPCLACALRRAAMPLCWHFEKLVMSYPSCLVLARASPSRFKVRMFGPRWSAAHPGPDAYQPVDLRPAANAQPIRPVCIIFRCLGLSALCSFASLLVSLSCILLISPSTFPDRCSDRPGRRPPPRSCRSRPRLCAPTSARSLTLHSPPPRPLIR